MPRPSWSAACSGRRSATGCRCGSGSILIGGILGSLARLDERLVALGDALQRRFARPGTESTVSLAFVTAATLGWGVLLTTAVILLYQGGAALGASFFASLLSEAQLREMSAVGGLLLLGVGLKLLSIRDVKVADFLPAIFVAPLLVAIVIRVKEILGI